MVTSVDSSVAKLRASSYARSSSPPTRTNSYVGSRDYMAPEVMGLMGSLRVNSEGYTRSVDFWSLGMTIHKLLTGMDAYTCLPREAFQTLFPVHVRKYEDYRNAYEAFFGAINYELSGLLTDCTRSLLQGLLQFESECRLGYNAVDAQAGFETLMHHPFFGGIDWVLLEAKQLPPPYIPREEVLDSMRDPGDCAPKTLPELLTEANLDLWTEEFKPADAHSIKRMRILPKEQQYFKMWHYNNTTSV